MIRNVASHPRESAYRMSRIRILNLNGNTLNARTDEGEEVAYIFDICSYSVGMISRDRSWPRERGPRRLMCASSLICAIPVS